MYQNKAHRAEAPDEETIAELHRRARELGEPASVIARLAMRDYLERKGWHCCANLVYEHPEVHFPRRLKIGIYAMGHVLYCGAELEARKSGRSKGALLREALREHFNPPSAEQTELWDEQTDRTLRPIASREAAMVAEHLKQTFDELAAEEMSAALGGKKVSGGWMAHCPTHDDKTPSLSISVKDKLLVHCHAGCDQERLLAELRRRGLWVEVSKDIANLLTSPSSAPPAPVVNAAADKPLNQTPDGRPFEKQYVYYDENGVPVHVTWRLPGNQFALGGVENFRVKPTMGSVEPVLYHLVTLMQCKPGDEIFLVEGEKDADRLSAMGIPSTTNVLGAGYWQDRYNAHFRDLHVVIFQDNDNKGRRGAERKARAISTVARSVRVHTFPELDEGAGLSDWLDQGRGADDLEFLADGLPLWRDPRRPYLKIVCMKDIEPQKVNWVWAPYIPRGKITLLDGDPGIGKSTLALFIAAALSRGDSLPGDAREGAEKENILLLVGEDGAGDTIRPRLDGMDADIGRIHIVESVVASGEERSLMLSDEGVKLIEEALRSRKFGMIVIDPLLAYLGGEVDMYRANQVRAMMDPLMRLAREYDVAILCIRHLVKSTDKRAIHRGIGSVDFAAVARSILLVARDPDNPQRSIVAPVKTSLAAAGCGQAFIIDGGFRWDGEVHMSADDALDASQEGRDGPRAEARQFLREVLKDGEVEAVDVKRLAEDSGISKRTLDRAKLEVGVISRLALVDGCKRWSWGLPSAMEGGE